MLQERKRLRAVLPAPAGLTREFQQSLGIALRDGSGVHQPLTFVLCSLNFIYQPVEVGALLLVVVKIGPEDLLRDFD